MTRSGLVAAALAATWAKGHCAGTLHDWTVLPFKRQPVSPMLRIRLGFCFGRCKVCPITEADFAVNGIAASHTVTGKSESGAARTCIGVAAPSIVICGQAASGVITRAIA